MKLASSPTEENMENLAREAARVVFQNALREALDMHHPQWDDGYKGRKKGIRQQKFGAIAPETIGDWVSGQCPQGRNFEAFLSEAEFPEETNDALLTAYRTFKREKRRSSQRERARQQSVLVLSAAEEQGDRITDDTIQCSTLMLREENMHETDRNDWLESNDRKLVEISVEVMGRRTIDEALPKLAKVFSPEDCADIVLHYVCRLF